MLSLLGLQTAVCQLIPTFLLQLTSGSSTGIEITVNYFNDDNLTICRLSSADHDINLFVVVVSHLLFLSAVKNNFLTVCLFVLARTAAQNQERNCHVIRLIISLTNHC